MKKLISDLENRFDYVVDYDFDYDYYCNDKGCEGICRCGRIVISKIVSFDKSYFAKEIGRTAKEE